MSAISEIKEGSDYYFLIIKILNDFQTWVANSAGVAIPRSEVQLEIETHVLCSNWDISKAFLGQLS